MLLFFVMSGGYVESIETANADTTVVELPIQDESRIFQPVPCSDPGVTGISNIHLKFPTPPATRHATQRSHTPLHIMTH